MRVIGLTGKAGAGKDYTYGLLAALFPKTERVGFADGVKDDIEETLGAMPYDLDALRIKPYSSDVRRLLQWWGTDLRRAEDPDFWVKYAGRSVEEARAWADLLVFTDVRFPNEADYIHDLGGLVVEVYTTDLIRRLRLGGTLPPAHASEDIDFPVDDRIYSPDGHVVAGEKVMAYLDLDEKCLKCRQLVPHPTHDDGAPTPFPWVNKGHGANVGS